MLNQPTIKSSNGIAGRNWNGTVWRGAVALALAVCLSGVAQAAQEQQQGQQQDGTQPEAKPKPAYPSQDADKPPYSKDRQTQTGSGGTPQGRQNGQYPPPGAPGTPGPRPGQSNPYPPQGGPGDQTGLAAQAAQYAQPVPGSLTVAPGTTVIIRTNEFLSSDKNKVGDSFTGVLDQPIVVNGWVVARRGQTVTGTVKAAVKAGRVKGVSQLGIELTDLTAVDGQQLPVLTELWKTSAGTSHGQDAGTIVGTSGLGAALGAAAGWGTGAAIGAGAGAAVGIAAVLLTRGQPTILPPETQLSFRLVDPVTIDTTRGQQAYYPVSQEDYESGRMERRGPPRMAGGYPPYACGPYAPCYGYPGYFYPGYVGVYGVNGGGPRYYGGYRGGYYGRYGYHH
jgi:hypothetical protein